MIVRTMIVAGALALASCSGDTADRFERAEASFEAGEYEEARIDLISVLDEDRDNAAALLLLARTELAQGNGAGARERLLRLQELGAVPDDYAFLLAEAENMRGNPEGALEALSQVETAEAYRLRAQALTGMNRIDEARETLRKGLDMPGDKGALYAEYAMFRLADGEIAEATRYVRLAEQSAPEALETYLAAGRLAQTQERIDDAIAIFGEGAEAYPTDLRLFEELAMALGQAGRFEEIEQLVEKGRARFGGTPEFTILRAKLAAEQGEWEQVRSLMQPIEAQLDNRPVAELLYATALYRLGQSELAYRRAQRLNRRFPGNPDAQSLLEEIEASL